MLQTINQVSRRILVADDDPVIRHLVAAIVKKEGYDVVTAIDGREAYRIMQLDARLVYHLAAIHRDRRKAAFYFRSVWVGLIAIAFLFSLLSGCSSAMDGVQNAARQRAIVA